MPVVRPNVVWVQIFFEKCGSAVLSKRSIQQSPSNRTKTLVDLSRPSLTRALALFKA
jgi:hypothetical protein